jgi:heavy metal-binding protein
MAFSARAELPVNGRMTMGYFDPWVTPAVRPVPPNRAARFQCPMHDGMISEGPGACPLCGMALVPLRRVPPAALHGTDYDMRLELGPEAEVVAGTRTRLRFVPLVRGQSLRDLAVVHEHPLHLIIVSADFDVFDHVHPTLEPDGSLVLWYTFPSPREYLLYADITPAGHRAQVFRLPVVVRAPEGAPQPPPRVPDLRPSPTLSQAVDGEPGVTAELRFQPRTPMAGIETHFLIRFSKDGVPVNDLEPYVGATAHAVFVSEDSEIFLHSHPEQLVSPAPAARGGPDVPFSTFFPRPGLYKLWVQFKRQGTVGLVSYVVEVKPTFLPASVVRFLLDD